MSTGLRGLKTGGRNGGLAHNLAQAARGGVSAHVIVASRQLIVEQRHLATLVIGRQITGVVVLNVEDLPDNSTHTRLFSVVAEAPGSAGSRENLPQLHIGIIDILGCGSEILLVNVHYSLAIAITGSILGDPARIDNVVLASLPIAPRRLGPSQEAVELLRKGTSHA